MNALRSLASPSRSLTPQARVTVSRVTISRVTISNDTKARMAKGYGCGLRTVASECARRPGSIVAGRCRVSRHYTNGTNLDGGIWRANQAVRRGPPEDLPEMS